MQFTLQVTMVIVMKLLQDDDLELKSSWKWTTIK